MDLTVEIIRSLYHLDLFRRSFRSINFHKCTQDSQRLLNDHYLQMSPVSSDSQSVSSCIVCSFKEIFNELNLSMRQSFLDPPLVCKIIESRMIGHMGDIEDFNNNLKYKTQSTRNLLPAYAFRNPSSVSFTLSPPAIYDYIFGKLATCVEMPPICDVNVHHKTDLPHWKDLSNLKTEYSLTKICLECRTTTHIETITQFIHQVDSSNLISNDWPSFEFGLKSALDSVEFCVKPNCHGQTKIFRCLRSFPDIIGLSFTDSSTVSTLHILPSIMRPYLVFESSTTTDMNLKSLVLHSRQWGHASLFFHSRLEMWIFIDKRQIVSLCGTWTEAKLHPILNGYRAIVVFYCHDKDAKRSLPVSIPTTPEMQPDIPSRLMNKNQEVVTRHAHRSGGVVRQEEDRIYENWPVDSDSGQGSNEESSSSCSYGAAVHSFPPDLDGRSQSHLHRKPSTLSTNSSNSLMSSPDSKALSTHSQNDAPTERIHWRNDKRAGVGGSPSKNKFATIRRKCKYNSPTTNPEKNFSISVPDLRSISSSPLESSPKSQNSSKMLRGPPPEPYNVNSETAFLYSQFPPPYGKIGDISYSIELPDDNSSKKPSKSAIFKPHLTNNNHSASSQSDHIYIPPNSLISSNYVNYKSVDNSSVSSNKKVSFNCEVTLVNDEDDEYIPHPIFQSVINKLNKM